jgi:hypothetical protein
MKHSDRTKLKEKQLERKISVKMATENQKNETLRGQSLSRSLTDVRKNNSKSTWDF